jgi:tetratricopeptide (TPR) repeat protein
MQSTNLKAFTDRHGIIALFRQLNQRTSQQQRLFLPILTIIGPEGTGKRTLIEYLRLRECSTVDGRPSQPYAVLDFAQPHLEHDILSVFIALRNQLQRNGSGKVKFPRFDLGALIAITTPSDEDILRNANPDALANAIRQNTPRLEAISTAGNELSNFVPLMKPIVSALKVGWALSEVRDVFVLQLQKKALEWYQSNSDDAILRTGTDLEALRRLLVFGSINNPDRKDILIEDLLPRAFIADLCESMQDSEKSAVVFLDSFEILLDNADSGNRLLEVLMKNRQSGQNDPLLLMICSQKPLSGTEELRRQLQLCADAPSPEEKVDQWLACWSQQLPKDWRRLKPSHLCLPLELAPFELEDTRNYLQLASEGLESDTQLIEAIHEVTHGYPSYVAFIADAIMEAQTKGQEITPDEIRQMQGPMQPMREVLLSLLFTRLLDEERNDLIMCAVPQSLDVDTLRIILPSIKTDLMAQTRWEHYLNFSFFYVTKDGKQLILLPFVRNLLLQKLPPNANPMSDYYQVHKILQEYFHNLAITHENDVRVQCEEAYHAWALGDVEPAISYAIKAQQENPMMWEPLLQAVMHAPTELLSLAVKQQAAIALTHTKQEHTTRDCVRAIIIYTSLLNHVAEGTHEVAHIYHNLGDAYSSLPDGDIQANMRRAIEYYKKVLTILNSEVWPDDWAETQNDLGNIFRTLPSRDPQKNLQEAIKYYQEAITVRTAEVFPRGWAETQTDMAIAYDNLLTDNRLENQHKALECCQKALLTCTSDIFPVTWARTQDTLGIIYALLSTGNHQENLHKAIEHYNAALQVRQRHEYPTDWAESQNNLGNGYLELEGLDRQKNLELAISYYMAALEVFTQQDHPREWAKVNNYLGLVYMKLPIGDRQEYVKQAIDFYKLTLQVHTKEAFTSFWAETLSNLGEAYWALPGGDRKGNLLHAIECHEEVLTVITRDSDAYTWAEAHHYLGNAYRDLLDDQRTNVQRAIEEHYNKALEVQRSDVYPKEWASIQTDLGIAYWVLPEGDRQTNLKKAIQCYLNSLNVFTPKHYIFDWATTQHHLGNAYRDWSGEDRQMYLQRAIRCYEAALEVRKKDAFPMNWAETQYELGLAYQYWQEGDQQISLQKAIECFQGALQAYQLMHINYRAQAVEKRLVDAQHEIQQLT